MIFRRFPLFLLVSLGGIAQADSSIDLPGCVVVAGKYHANPFSLELAEIDLLRTCLNWQYAAKMSDDKQKQLKAMQEKSDLQRIRRTQLKDDL